MERSVIKELHYITDVENWPSMAKIGLLSHNGAKGIEHVSIASEEVQENRVDKQVPNGLKLHDYVNLYIDGRNAMMFDRKGPRIIVVRVDPIVMDIQGAVVADGNAASRSTGFYKSPEGLAILDQERVFARYWTDSDYWTYVEKKRQRQAEILVPYGVLPQYIIGCYVYNSAWESYCASCAPTVSVEVNKHVYFE